MILSRHVLTEWQSALTDSPKVAFPLLAVIPPCFYSFLIVPLLSQRKIQTFRFTKISELLKPLLILQIMQCLEQTIFK
jgi:hypothetical protein